MIKRNKRWVVFGLLFLCSMVILALGWKYFPFTKLVKMPAGSEKEFVNPDKVTNLAPNTLYYDFEVAPGKEMPGGFYKGLAHSGQYSVKAFGQNSFSIAVERTAGEVGVENLKAVALSAWIYVFPTKKEVKGSLVFTASNEVGVNVCWQGIGIVEPEVPRGKWFKISKYFDLTPVTFKPGYKLQVYFWNNSSADILIDDYFISFGAPADRRGDSARVDMTKAAGYVPKFNYPPFPVSFLEIDPMDKGLNAAEIGPGDLAVSGDFLNTGNDGLLVVGKDGKAAAYARCPGDHAFKKITVSDINVFTTVSPVKKILKGKFITSRGDQFMVVGEKGRMLCALDPPENVCSSTGALQAVVKVLWRSGASAVSTCAGDFNGDRRSEILETEENGSWKVIGFEPGGNSGGTWKVLAQDGASPVNEWDRNRMETGISAGRYFPGVAHDVVLTVTRNKNDGKYAYSLRKLNVPGRKWEPLFSGKQEYMGITAGLDTLKPTDEFYALTDRGNSVTVFRYNRDWRYDLKEIRFNDSTFCILSSTDFLGYEKDQNPKYYESLKLVPGCYLDPSTASFLVAGHVSKVRHYQSVLPDFARLYSLPVNK